MCLRKCKHKEKNISSGESKNISRPSITLFSTLSQASVISILLGLEIAKFQCISSVILTSGADFFIFKVTSQ